MQLLRDVVIACPTENRLCVAFRNCTSIRVKVGDERSSFKDAPKEGRGLYTFDAPNGLVKFNVDGAQFYLEAGTYYYKNKIAL